MAISAKTGEWAAWPDLVHRRSVLFAPHPDDEVIGAFSVLSRNPRDRFLTFVTDGAPVKLGIRRASLQCRRQSESHRVAEFLEVPAAQVLRFNVPDQETAFQLPWLIHRTLRVLKELDVDVVLLPAYEGGHPDHDSTAFAVHRAARMLGAHAPQLVEMSLYHSRNGAMETGKFLNCPGASEVHTVPLSEGEQRLKREAFAIYYSQRQVLKYFPIEFERFRLAPAYDFLSPPHAGKLFYEQFDWNITGTRWRQLASEVLRESTRPFSV